MKNAILTSVLFVVRLPLVCCDSAPPRLRPRNSEAINDVAFSHEPLSAMLKVGRVQRLLSRTFIKSLFKYAFFYSSRPRLIGLLAGPGGWFTTLYCTQMKSSLRDQLASEQIRAEFQKFAESRVAKELPDFYQVFVHTRAPRGQAFRLPLRARAARGTSRVSRPRPSLQFVVDSSKHANTHTPMTSRYSPDVCDWLARSVFAQHASTPAYPTSPHPTPPLDSTGASA